MRLLLFLTLTIKSALVLVSCTDAPSVDALLVQAEEERAAGEVESALFTLNQAVSLKPDDPEIRLLMASTYIDLNRGDLASVSLDRALERGIDPNRVLLPQADALLLQSKHVELLDLMLPDDFSPIERAMFLHRQAQARSALFVRKLEDGDTVTRAYIELFNLVHRLSETSEVSPIVTALDESRRSDENVERAWQHFACRNNEYEPIFWEPSGRGVGDVVYVGASRELKTPADAARVANDGATIEIDPGTYPGGVARWPQHRLTVRGVGDQPVITASGEAVADRDVWLFEGDDVTVENVEISGARSPYENGAGIRHMGNGLTLRHVYLHHNENGVLTGNRHPDSRILIEHSEFAHNGDGKGQAHNIYIGRSGRFEMRSSYSHESKVGHLVKSRARENVISYNRLSDNEDGSSSYVIDIPEGGVAEIIGNVLQQGYSTANHAMFSFGAEEVPHDENRLLVASNTLYNRDFRGIGVRNNRNLDIQFINNLVAGAPLLLVDGAAEDVANQRLAEHGLADPRSYDFGLVAGAHAIDMGSDAGPEPIAEYVHPLGSRTRHRIWKLDIGAYERCGI